MSEEQPPGPGKAENAETLGSAEIPQSPGGPETPDWAHSFGGVADAYERGRPSYPPEAAQWLLGERPKTVLELGAGTGKLTRVLVELGHDVHATDPDEVMLAVLEEKLPGIRTAVASAEEIPLAAQSVDAVIAAQAFHWFDLDRALPEIARVLRPEGRLCLLWNQRNEKIPWVRRLGGLIGTQEQLGDPAQALIFSELFGFVEEHEFNHWQVIDRQSIQDLVLSRSNVAVLDEEGRRAKLAEVVAFYDEYGRGMDGMQLPYVTCCYRATVLDRTSHDDAAGGPAGAAPDGDGGDDGPDDDMVLIDFR
jgi:ubiquinone/menaquinone biosynthesis C-methylase UbiE